MLLTLKTEATKPASPNFLHQQARFDAFIERFNQERPHQALGMKVPGALYTPSSRPYRGLGDLDYPFHDWTATVTRCGRICYDREKINLSTVFAGQNVGVKQRRRTTPPPGQPPRLIRQPRPASHATQHPQRHVPVELGVSGPIHFAHAAFANLGGDGVGAGSSPVATSESGLPPCVTKDSRWIGR